MKMLLKPAFAAGIALAALAAPVAIAPAAAQTVAGIGIVNAPLVIANSAAFKTAQTQRPVTYKAQIDQANARRAAIGAQLEPLYTKLQADSRAANPNQASLQQQAAAIQQIEQNGQRELNQILAPVQLSQAYVEEQIADKLSDAITAAATKRKVTLILSPDSVIFADNAAYNMNQAVLTELDALIPNAQLVPPQGWLPREMREQQQQQQQAAGQQPAAATPAAPVSGR